MRKARLYAAGNYFLEGPYHGGADGVFDIFLYFLEGRPKPPASAIRGLILSFSGSRFIRFILLSCQKKHADHCVFECLPPNSRFLHSRRNCSFLQGVGGQWPVKLQRSSVISGFIQPQKRLRIPCSCASRATFSRISRRSSRGRAICEKRPLQREMRFPASYRRKRRSRRHLSTIFSRNTSNKRGLR